MHRNSLLSGFYSGTNTPSGLNVKSRPLKRSAPNRIDLGFDSSESEIVDDPGVSGLRDGSDYGLLVPMDLTEETARDGPRPGKKTKGRVKIKMEFIENKLRRYTTFSKRKTGIMKKAYELSTLTGTQVMLLVASETGHVYTFATRKLQPMITSESGKALIQTCLNSPDYLPSTSTNSAEFSVPPSRSRDRGTPESPRMPLEDRMNPSGFEEPDLGYAACEENSFEEDDDDYSTELGLNFDHHDSLLHHNLQIHRTNIHKTKNSLAHHTTVGLTSPSSSRSARSIFNQTPTLRIQPLAHQTRLPESSPYSPECFPDEDLDQLDRYQGPINLVRVKPSAEPSIVSSANLNGISKDSLTLAGQSAQELLCSPSMENLPAGALILKLPKLSTKPKTTEQPQQQSQLPHDSQGRQPPFITIPLPPALAANAQLIQALFAQQQLQLQQQKSKTEISTNNLDVTPTDLTIKSDETDKK